MKKYLETGINHNYWPLFFLVLFLALWGCEKKPMLTPEEAAEARRTIIAWMECEECTDGELEVVVKLGKTAIPSLSAILGRGPSQSKREVLRRHLVKSYQKLKYYETTHPEAKVPMNEDEFIKTYMDNYIALYQIRSAEALAVIGGSDAKKALKEALQVSIRDDVRAVVNTALEKL